MRFFLKVVIIEICICIKCTTTVHRTLLLYEFMFERIVFLSSDFEILLQVPKKKKNWRTIVDQHLRTKVDWLDRR